MSENLQWVFSLVDRMSGPANNASKSLDRINKTLNVGTVVVNKFGAQSRGTGSSFGTIVTGLNQGVELAGRFASVLEGVAVTAAHAAQSFGEFVIERARMQESTMVGLRTLLGSDRAARAEFQSALLTAQATPFDTRQVVDSRRALVTAGFTRAHDRDVIFAALSDLASMNPGDSETLGRATTALSQIHAAGQLRGQELLQLENAGLNRARIFDALVPMLAIRDREPERARRAVMAAMRGGRVNGDMAIRAVVQAIQQQAGGGQLGSFTRAQSQTLNGLISNMQSLGDDLLLRLDLEHLPGLQAFKGVLQNILGFFDRGSVDGTRFLEVVKTLVQDLFGGLFQFGGRGDVVRNVLRNATSAGEALHRVLGPIVAATRQFVLSFGPAFMQTAGPGLRMLTNSLEQFSGRGLTGAGAAGHALGRILGQIVDLGSRFVADMLPAIQMFFSALNTPGGLTAIGQTLGSSLMAGFTQGIRNAMPAPIGAMYDAARGTIQIAQTVLGVHSPSTVFAAIGGHVADGFALGIMGGAPMAHDAMAGLVRAPVLSASLGSIASNAARANATGGNNIEVQVIVDGAHASAEDIAREVARVTPSAILDAFEQLANEAGAR